MNKAGPYSEQDKQYVRNNVDIMSPEDIAAHLHRNPESVINLIKREKLGNAKIREAKGLDVKQSEILSALKKKPFYKKLKEQFTDSELQYFSDYWVLTIKDFGGGILSYEELELKEWLTFEILKTRILINKRKNTEQRETYKDLLRRQIELPKEERDREHIKFLSGEIALIDDTLKGQDKEFADLATKADKIKQGLVKSRAQRTKDMDMADFSFQAYLKILMKDYDKRKRTGEEMEIIKMAEAKKREEMYKPYVYADGNTDLPILCADSVGVNTGDNTNK